MAADIQTVPQPFLTGDLTYTARRVPHVRTIKSCNDVCYQLPIPSEYTLSLTAQKCSRNVLIPYGPTKELFYL